MTKPKKPKKKAAKKAEPTYSVAEQLLAKAAVASGDASDEMTALQMFNSTRQAWMAAAAEKPPYDPATMLTLVEQSSALRQCIVSMATGVHGYGHQFEPVIDTKADDILDRIKAAIILEREADREAEVEALLLDGKDDEEAQEVKEVDYDVGEQEAKERLVELERQITRQLFKAEAWFDECCPEMPFTDLRQRMSFDRDGIGHGVIEAAEDQLGKPVRLGYLAGHTVYPVILPEDKATVTIEVEKKVSPISTRTYNSERKFSVYVQLAVSDTSKKVYFKQLGDPRTVSRLTGHIYDDAKEMKTKEPNAPPANSVLFFAVHSPRSPAGIPRYIGNLADILGMRAAEETNYLYFDNKSVPIGAWVITGGTVANDVREYLENFIEREVKNREGFHKSIVIEIAGPDAKRDMSPREVKVQWISMQGDQRTDASFLKYNKDGRDKVGASFRLPPLMRGEAPSDLTRANAYASLEFVNEQVFQPERLSFDWAINKHIMASIGCALVKFVSNSPVTTDPELVAKFTEVIAKHGGFVPDDVRKVAATTLNMELDPIEGDWAFRPLALTLAGIVSDVVSGTGTGDEEEDTQVKVALLRRVLKELGLDPTSALPPIEQVDGVATGHEGPVGDVDLDGDEEQ